MPHITITQHSELPTVHSSPLQHPTHHRTKHRLHATAAAGVLLTPAGCHQHPLFTRCVTPYGLHQLLPQAGTPCSCCCAHQLCCNTPCRQLPGAPAATADRLHIHTYSVRCLLFVFMPQVASCPTGSPSATLAPWPRTPLHMHPCTPPADPVVVGRPMTAVQ